MKNSTAEEDHMKDFRFLLMLPDPSNEETRNYYQIVFNSLSSFVAAVFNLLLILVFVKTPSLRTPSYILIAGLALADFGVGVVAQPMYCLLLSAWLTENRRLYETNARICHGMAAVFVEGSFLTVTAITIDRFLAVHLHLRYQEFVTTERSYIVLSTIWVGSLLWTVVIWLMGKESNGIVNFSLLFLITLLDIYLMLKISRIIQRHRVQIQAQQQHQQPAMNMQRYRKSVNTMYYILGVFLVCYLPGLLLLMVAEWMTNAGFKIGTLFALALHFSYTLGLLNSVLNPFIYCWRIEEIRNALVLLVRRQ